ncbi:uncharacterized protein [Clytia hemisphaerica]|uniref:EGF-like domain-containing protein n=1 Tax=Clytia hemisphaerica TaxID=252671 RepID=A0A7M5VEL3_9CNID
MNKMKQWTILQVIVLLSLSMLLNAQNITTTQINSTTTTTAALPIVSEQNTTISTTIPPSTTTTSAPETTTSNLSTTTPVPSTTTTLPPPVTTITLQSNSSENTTTTNSTITTNTPTTTKTTPTTTTTTPTTTTITPTTTTTTTTQPPSASPSIYNMTFSAINETSYCNCNGYLFQNADGTTKLCSCFEDFHGLQCEDKVNTWLLKIVFALAILAVIFLIAAIFTGCQWHSRLGDIEEKEAKVKNLAHEKDQLKKQNLDLRRRSPSPSGRPRSNYAPSNYAPSVVGSPNGGFYDDDRRSVMDMSMPTFDAMQQKRLSQQFTANGDVALEMEEDELDATPNENKDGGNMLNPDTVSIHSASTTNSEMVLIPKSPRNNKQRRPVSQEIPSNAIIDNRGYMVQPRGARSRSPSPTNSHHSDLSMENMKQFDRNGGLMEPQRGRARSLMDLRVIALTGEAQKYPGETPGSNLYKSKSIENILTGQVHKLSPQAPSSNVSTSSGGRGRPMGIFAQQQQRDMADSAF